MLARALCDTPTASPMHRRKRSSVWLYFTPVDGFQAKCDLCEKCVFHSGNNRKLRNHLRIIHVGKLDKFQCRQEEEEEEEEKKKEMEKQKEKQEKQANPECCARERQTSLTEASQGGSHYPVSSPSALLPMALLAKKRHDSSLHLLTQRFLQLLCFSVDGVLDLRMAADVLKASRRRLYDITNVLQGIGLIRKTSPRKIKWLGDAAAMVNKLLQVDIEEEQQLDELIQTCTWHIYQMCSDQTSWRFAYLTYEDLQSIPSLKEQTVLVIKAPVETKMEVPNPEESLQVRLSSTKGPIEVFFCSDDPIPVGTKDNAHACGYNSTPPNSSTNRKGSLSSSPRSSFVQASSEDGDNDTSRSDHISNLPFELSQHSSLVTVTPISTLPSLRSPSDEEHSLVTLTPPTGLSVEGEDYSLSLAEDDGITNLFSGDLDCLDLDMHMI